ncbi:MAG TPA: hypothetical protein V6C81_08810 [Planktothrix sp.]|jgi:hypothetical protein
MSPDVPDEIVGAQPKASSDGWRLYGMSPISFACTNVFIVCWFALTAIHIAPPGQLHDTLEDLSFPLTDLIKFNQHWSMFSPSVRDFNEHGQSVITFEDGSVKLYEWYRQDRQDPFHHWLHGKMRELWLDQLLDKTMMEHLYPSVCRYTARANLFPHNQPEHITLGANWAKIPSFEKPSRIEDLPQEFNHYTLSSYKVRPEDLK